jgi:integrase
VPISAPLATEFGTAVDPRNVLRTIEIAAQKAGIVDVGVHTLRHSAAVAWLEAGVHIKAVADLLGHSSISITVMSIGTPRTRRRGRRSTC